MKIDCAKFISESAKFISESAKFISESAEIISENAKFISESAEMFSESAEMKIEVAEMKINKKVPTAEEGKRNRDFNLKDCFAYIIAYLKLQSIRQSFGCIN